MSELSFVLENRKVKISPFAKTDGLITSTDKSGSKPFEGTKQVYGLPNKEGQYSYLEILTEKEQKEFERLLQVPANSLSFYVSDKIRLKENFWSKFKLPLTFDGLNLDLTNPTENLQFRVAKALKHLIAPSWGERLSRQEYRYYIEEEDVKNAEILEQSNITEEGWTKYGEIKNRPSTLLSILKIAGKQISQDKATNTDHLKAEVSNMLKETGPNGKQIGMKKFLDIVNDPDFELRVLVADAVKFGAMKIPVRKPEFLYELPDGERLGNIKATIAKLKEPEYMQTFMTLQARVQTAEGK